MTASLLFTLVFAVALCAGALLKLWLASRQIRHVVRHRDAVPAGFAERISLAAHQKAAAYTVAKARFGMLELALGVAVLASGTKVPCCQPRRKRPAAPPPNTSADSTTLVSSTTRKGVLTV